MRKQEKPFDNIQNDISIIIYLFRMRKRENCFVYHNIIELVPLYRTMQLI